MDKKQKGIITAAIVIVAVLAAYKILKPSKGNNGGGGSGNNGGGGGSNNGGGGGSNNGGGGGSNNGGGGGTQNLDFTSLANQLFDAFDGYYTREDEIKTVFESLRSNADYDALKSAYGVREVSSGRFNIFVKNFEGDLPATLRDELDSDELAEINQILANKGINRTI